MTASHDPINAAAGTISASTTNLFPDLRGLFTVLLVLAAMLSISAEPARADIEAPHAINGHAEAPVEAGIDAAKAGRIRDAITILTPHADSGHAMANYVLGLIYLRDQGALTSRPTQSHRHFPVPPPVMCRPSSKPPSSSSVASAPLGIWVGPSNSIELPPAPII